MTWPTLVVPQEYSKITVPLGPVRCPECSRTGIPEPVLTCLGDFVLRMGGWCTSCRVFCCLLDVSAELMDMVTPSKFLLYDQRLPDPGVSYPRARRSFFDMTEFPFGANVTEGGDTVRTQIDGEDHDPQVTKEEAAAAHREALDLLAERGINPSEVYTLWGKVGFKFETGTPRRSQVARFRALVSGAVMETGETT